MENVLEMKGIVKSFPGLIANDHIDFSLRKGEIHTLLGENGAGKSTLMSILAGLYQANEGTISLFGKRAEITSPNKAIELGIGMVYQHFMLIPAITVVENIVLGLKSPKEPWLQKNAAINEINKLSNKYNFNIKPKKLVSDLSIGEQQRLEIFKALYRGAKILVLDEPTAVLTPDESKNIFKLIRNLTKEGISVIFISHKLNEVMEISDRVTILRRGKKISTVNIKDATAESLAEMMVGKKVDLAAFEKVDNAKDEVLSLNGITYYNKYKRKILDNISFSVFKGEILGIAGVDGNGQSELAKIVTGILTPQSGTINISNKNYTGKSAKEFIENGVAHIPEDRNLMGLVGDLSLTDNFVLKNIDKIPFSIYRGWKLMPKNMDKHAAELVEKYDIRCSGKDCLVKDLSGGNQQKVIIARELFENINILIAVHPSRGVDIGATNFVHHQIINARDNGAAILLISSDLDEILRLSDRIACIYEGKIMGILKSSEFELDKIGMMIAGSKIKEGEKTD
ncbi:MAG: ABC transporter ATP-binding protein [Oscillospiraceae bacterium]|nr:ABC transporter ATP-binding protein [Oscillospiraceae bacterium]